MSIEDGMMPFIIIGWIIIGLLTAAACVIASYLRMCEELTRGHYPPKPSRRKRL